MATKTFTTTALIRADKVEVGMKLTDGIVESVVDSPERDGALIISFADTVRVGNIHKVVRWDQRTWPYKLFYRVVVQPLVTSEGE